MVALYVIIGLLTLAVLILTPLLILSYMRGCPEPVRCAECPGYRECPECPECRECPECPKCRECPECPDCPECPEQPQAYYNIYYNNSSRYVVTYTGGMWVSKNIQSPGQWWYILQDGTDGIIIQSVLNREYITMTSDGVSLTPDRDDATMFVVERWNGSITWAISDIDKTLSLNADSKNTVISTTYDPSGAPWIVEPVINKKT